MSSESLSGVVKISGKAFAPQKILSQFLAAVVQALGPGFLGHVKGIARFHYMQAPLAYHRKLISSYLDMCPVAFRPWILN
jgi:hypothetical protein